MWWEKLQRVTAALTPQIGRKQTETSVYVRVPAAGCCTVAYERIRKQIQYKKYDTEMCLAPYWKLWLSKEVYNFITKCNKTMNIYNVIINNNNN